MVFFLSYLGNISKARKMSKKGCLFSVALAVGFRDVRLWANASDFRSGSSHLCWNGGVRADTIVSIAGRVW